MDRTTSFGLWSLANKFAQAARIVHDALATKETPGAVALGYVVDVPSYYLAGHAIELALKGYLRGAGAELSEMKKIGHNLVRCLERAEQVGLAEEVEISAEFREMIAMLNEYYEQKEFEYIVTGPKSFPLLETVLVNAEFLIKLLRAFSYRNRDRHMTSA